MEGRHTRKPCSFVDRWRIYVQHVDTGHDSSPWCRFECTPRPDAFPGLARLLVCGYFPWIDDVLFRIVGGTSRSPPSRNGWVALLVDGADNDRGRCLPPSAATNIRRISRFGWSWLGSHVPEVSAA